MPVQPWHDLDDSENGFIWSSQHWNMSLWASKNLYRWWNWTLKTFLVVKGTCITSTTVTTALLHLSKLNFSTFLVPKHICTTFTRPPRKWKRLYRIFPALKQESTSIAQPLQWWKLWFRTFLVLKDACTTSTIVKTALSDVPSAETGVHKHRTTSILVETEV